MIEVMCNKAWKYPYCKSCVHSEPHRKGLCSAETFCTEWCKCYPYNDGTRDNEFIKVRCVKVK